MYVSVAKERASPMRAALFPGLESQTLSVRLSELSTGGPLSLLSNCGCHVTSGLTILQERVF